ncbi:MAG TPA: mandelate racemase/muconate lactonizing enzyme family protein [Thermodesulfobacteriota bacterium]|nr:mandelate racemase/muconate lactonizing enzyme family protein [Thermodesulfobacteriota bacterium]
MKITGIETFVVDAGWRPWTFVKVETDEGITGYGECSVSRGPFAVVGAVEDLKPDLIGTDPRAYEVRLWEMSRRAIAEPLGVRAKAIAGVELALLDIKAKALGISVVELFGGPVRDSVRLYWSHCATTRALYPEMGTPPIRTMGDVAAVGKEVVRRGYTALKTNIVIPGEPARVHFDGFGGSVARGTTTDQVASTKMINHIETLIGTFRDAVGPEVDICLDLNFNFRPESCIRIAKALEPYNLLWLEIDMYDPAALRQIKDSTSTKICTGENLIYMKEFLPYFQARCADVFMVDTAWMGFSPSKQVGDLARAFEYNIAPHNYYSHLSTFISASLCGALTNIRILETDVDDVPLREELVTRLPEIKDGYMKIPRGPGWGTDLNEDAARKNPWHKPKARW